MLARPPARGSSPAVRGPGRRARAVRVGARDVAVRRPLHPRARRGRQDGAAAPARGGSRGAPACPTTLRRHALDRAVAARVRRGGGPRRRVLLLDTYESAGGDRRLAARAIPARAAVRRARGHRRPRPARARWREDPGWRDLLRAVSLRNLDRDDARAYLRVAACPTSQHEAALAATHGHPLALRSWSKCSPSAKGRVELGAAPDVVRELLTRFVADAPSARHRQALDVVRPRPRHDRGPARRRARRRRCRRAVRLAARPVVRRAGPATGLFPHDIVRDALDADLRWRDRAGYGDQHRRIRRHVVERLRATSGGEQQRARRRPDLPPPQQPVRARDLGLGAASGSPTPSRCGPSDRAAILAMVERHEGPESRAMAAYWLDRQPRGLHRLPRCRRRADRLHGGARSPSRRASRTSRSDPGARAMWAYVIEHGAAAAGREVLCGRFFMDRDATRRRRRRSTSLTIAATQLWLSRPRLAWELHRPVGRPRRRSSR